VKSGADQAKRSGTRVLRMLPCFDSVFLLAYLYLPGEAETHGPTSIKFFYFVVTLTFIFDNYYLIRDKSFEHI